MISVIVPYKNAEPWIARCVQSLVRQKSDAQFILVDDHSIDRSHEIVEEIAGGDLRFFFAAIMPPELTGVSAARNYGMHISSGDWITFLDADDAMLPNGIETYEEIIRTAPEANIHQLNHMRYYASIDKLTMKYMNEEGAYTSKDLPKMWFGVWNKLFRRSLLREVDFDESLQYGEDGLFILECLAKDDRIHHARKSVAAVTHYFDNPNSLSHSKTIADLYWYVSSLESFILRQNNPDLRRAVCRILSECWGSDTYQDIIGGRQ